MTIGKFMMIVQVTIAMNALIVLLSFLFFKRRSIEIKLMGLYFTTPLMSYYGIDVFDAHGMEVNIPQNIEMSVHFLIVTRMYYLSLQKRCSAVFLIVPILFLIFSSVNIFFIQKMYFNSYTVTVSDVIIIVYCVAYFYRLLIDLPAQHLHALPMFWFSAAFLMYAAGTLFLYIFTDYLTKFFFDDVLIYWTFHNFLNIFQQILIIIGVAVDLKNVTSTRLSAIKSV